MFGHYGRSRKKQTVETMVIWTLLLIAAAISAWLPYWFAQLGRLGITLMR